MGPYESYGVEPDPGLLYCALKDLVPVYPDPESKINEKFANLKIRF